MASGTGITCTNCQIFEGETNNEHNIFDEDNAASFFNSNSAPYAEFHVIESKTSEITLSYDGSYSFTPDYIFMKVEYVKDGKHYYNVLAQYVFSVFDPEDNSDQTTDASTLASTPAFTTVPTDIIIISKSNPTATLPAIDVAHTEPI